MLLSFALIFIVGMLAGRLCSKAKLPPLMGMLITGIVIGPSVLNLLDTSLLAISADLRRIALIIILLRAGLNLRLDDLKKVGRSAILMCFVPACFEIAGMLLAAPVVFGLSLLDSLILGTVIAAVSPAVIVPHMLKIMDEGYGVKQGIPQMILAGASADDVFVIVLFTSFTGIAAGQNFEIAGLMRIPGSILLGIAAGAALGYVLHLFLSKIHTGIEKALILFLSVSFLLVTAEDWINDVIGFSGLIAVMAMGMMFAAKSENDAANISKGLSKLWTAAEILLFVLVGAAVDISYAFHAGAAAVLLIFAVLLFRMLGVAVCLIGTKLNHKEKLFCMIAYTPKATVQAAIGAIPLSMGLSCGNTVLTVAVIAILITAPLGAFLIDLTYRRFLTLQ
ncbi:MAG: cation:proton antiporter [Solobacterium sp.]|nr:cation:proton antiporter [Solobacterium sp.]